MAENSEWVQNDLAGKNYLPQEKVIETGGDFIKAYEKLTELLQEKETMQG